MCVLTKAAGNLCHDWNIYTVKPQCDEHEYDKVGRGFQKNIIVLMWLR